MPFDGMVLAAIKNELNETLAGCRIERVYQPRRYEIHLILSRPKGKYRLVLSADPLAARVHLTETACENPAQPPVFCMVLRKHLEGGRIARFSQQGYDRVLTISVDTRDEIGRTSTKNLACEIMGKHSNIILYDPDTNIILDGIKRYSHAVSRHREVLPGLPYTPPPAQEKIDPLSISDEDFFKIILQENLDTPLRDIIQRRFDGLSPVMAREVIFRAGLDPGITPDTCGQYDLTSVYISLKDLYARAKKGDFTPTVIFSGKAVRDFTAFDLTHAGDCPRKTGTMNRVTDIFFSVKNLAAAVEQTRHSLLGTVRKELSRLKKKLSVQVSDIEAAGDAERFRIAGELITANIHRLNRGDTEVYLDNFYLENCPREKVTLDARLSPSENAQAFFRRYNKAKKTKETASLHAQKTREEIDYLSGVENCLEIASTMEDLEQIRQELIDQGYIKSPAAQKQRAKSEKQAVHPIPAKFVSSDGLTILAGKNNRQNDYLTMKLAHPDDIWLHTREIPGAHVIIKTEGNKVPPSTLEEAASLAALFSKAGRSSKVPVDYTARKFVSKPRGAKPGFVIYINQKTIIAEPDQSLPEKLARQD
ncbi:MAG: Rqc2 family fibronectin-binding protein [Bacillota bacterium]